MLLPNFLLPREAGEFNRLCLISHSTDETNDQSFEAIDESVVLSKAFYSESR